MRLLETVSEITTFLTQDVSHILGEEDESSMALGLIGKSNFKLTISLLVTNFSRPQIILHNWQNIRLGLNFWLINDLITFDLIPITANPSALASIFNIFYVAI